MPASFCTNCGARLPDWSTRCASCGPIAAADGASVATEAIPVVTDRPFGSPRAGSVEKVGPAEAAGTLEVIRGRNSGARFIVGAETTLGRHPDSDIFLDDVSVSRAHATIVLRSSSEFVVTDAGSLNGTYLNNERVDQATLQHGDVLQIGMFKLAFVTGSSS